MEHFCRITEEKKKKKVCCDELGASVFTRLQCHLQVGPYELSSMFTPTYRVLVANQVCMFECDRVSVCVYSSVCAGECVKV